MGMMYQFGDDSKRQLSTCHSDLQCLFNEVIKYFDCTIIEGYRNKDSQEKAFNAGNSKLHFPHGKHNRLPSIAVDVSPSPIDWNNTKRFYWFAGFVLGVAAQLKSHGKMKYDVRYGGDWDSDKDITDQNFNDLLHYELIA